MSNAFVSYRSTLLSKLFTSGSLAWLCLSTNHIIFCSRSFCYHHSSVKHLSAVISLILTAYVSLAATNSLPL